MGLCGSKSARDGGGSDSESDREEAAASPRDVAVREDERRERGDDRYGAAVPAPVAGASPARGPVEQRNSPRMSVGVDDDEAEDRDGQGSAVSDASEDAAAAEERDEYEFVDAPGRGAGEEEEEEEGDEEEEEEEEEAPPAAMAKPKLGPKATKKLRSRFRSRVRTIQSLDAEWKNRVNAMNALEEMIRVGDVVYISTWDKELAHLRTAIGTQLGDLRSNIVREACSLLVGTAARVGNTYAFDETLRGLLPALLHNLYVTTKAIADRSHETMIRVLELSNAVCASNDLCSWATTDTHSDVRSRCADYLALIVRKDPEEGYDQITPARLEAILKVVRANVGHADGTVRNCTRKLYRAVDGRFPEEAAALFDTLNGTQQRFLSGRRSGNVSASSSGMSVRSGSARRAPSKSKKKAAAAGGGKKKKKKKTAAAAAGKKKGQKKRR